MKQPLFFQFILLLGFLLMEGQGLFAQTSSVSGYVKDSLTQSPLVGATVVLHPKDSSQTKIGAICDENGYFSISLAKGIYNLQISYVSFQQLERLLTIEADSFFLDTIYLVEQQLNEVVVEGQRIAILQKGDTTIFNADAFSTRANASTEDLLRKMPGIQTEGELKVNGEEVVEVLVDGKVFSGQNKREALQNLPAQMVDKVEVYTYQSEHAKASNIRENESKKTLNIVTKKQYKSSVFGGGELAGGANFTAIPLFSIDAKLNFFKEKQRANIQLLSKNVESSKIAQASSQTTPHHQITANYLLNWDKKGKGNISLSYNLINHQQKQLNQLSRTYFFIDSVGKYHEEENSSQNKNLSHFARIFIQNNTKKHRFNLNGFGQFKTGHTKTDNFINLSSPTQESAVQNIQNVQSEDIQNRFNLNTVYSYQFSKIDRRLTFSMTLNGNLMQDSTFRNISRIENISSNKDSSLQSLLNYSIKNNLQSKVSYTEPLGKKGQLQFQANFLAEQAFQKRWNYSLIEPFFLDRQLDSSLSTNAKRNAFALECSPAYEYKNNKFQYTLTFNTIWEKSDITNYLENKNTPLNYFRFRPSTYIKWQPDKKSFIQFSYQMQSRNPDFKEQNAVINNENPTVLYKGNAALKQEFRHNANIFWKKNTIEKGVNISTHIYFDYMQEKITNSLYAFSKDTFLFGTTVPAGTQMQIPVNLSGEFNIRGLFDYNRQLKFLSSNFNVNLSFNYGNLPGLFNGEKRNSKQVFSNASLDWSSNSKEQFDFIIHLSGNTNYTKNALVKGKLIWQQILKMTASWHPNKHFFTKSELLQQYTNNTKQFIINWNLEFGANFLKKEAGELSLQFYNLLNQNNRQFVQTRPLYNEVSQNFNILGRYFLLKFVYHLQPSPLNSKK